MSLAPIPVANVGQGKLTVAPGWSFDIDDFNMDVLKFSTMSSLSDALTGCPNKYDTLGQYLGRTIIFPGMPTQTSGIGSLSCSQRKIVPGEGLSAKCDLEFKGYIISTGVARNPVTSLTWTTGPYTVQVPVGESTITLNFVGPTQAQLTLKQGNTGAYNCQIGKVGTPFGSATVPLVITVEINVNGNITTLTLYSTSSQFTCTKHDRAEAGKYFSETQVWVLSYVAL